MSVLTNVLKKKDTKLDEIPETEMPSAADLDEVKPVDPAVREDEAHELSVDETDPAVVADAIAALEASDPNETANVDPSLVLEDTMVNTQEEFTATSSVTSNNPEAFLDSSEPDSARRVTPNNETEAQPEFGTATVASAPKSTVAATPATANRDNHRKLALAGILLAAVIAAAAYLFFVMLPGDTALAPVDTFASAEIVAEPGMLSAEPIDPVVEADPDVTMADTIEPSAKVIAQPERSVPVEARFAPLHTVEVGVDETAVKISSGIQINRERRDNPVFVGLSRAYAAYTAGDETSAAEFYRNVVEIEPTNRDALLGLASLAQSDGRFEEARFYFESLLELDPKDGVAATGLMSMQQQSDAVADESALKSMLREQPEAAHLHFGLGMRYVEQGRWPDAQTAFFDAVRFAPDHPDYSFNLAVSLDRLGKTSSAAIYYARSIDNANGLQSFDLAQAQARLKALNGG